MKSKKYCYNKFDLYRKILGKALEEDYSGIAGTYLEADYIRLNYTSREICYTNLILEKEGNYIYPIYYTFFYRTSKKKMEDRLNNSVKNTLNTLHVNKQTSQYKKVKLIYDWISRYLSKDSRQLNCLESLPKYLEIY